MIKYIFKRLIIAINIVCDFSCHLWIEPDYSRDPVLNKVKGKANPDGVMEQSEAKTMQKSVET